jgi:hypothetical protein
MVGRAIALGGIVCGLLALGLPLYSLGGHYADDGTTFGFLLVLLSLASLFPSEVGRDLLVAAGGAAAFGFFLFAPATAAFDELGLLGAGAWLGLCTALIPIGLLVAARRERPPGAPERSRDSARGVGLPVCTVGLALAVAGIWLDADSSGPSYWNASSSGHAIGILMLVLVVLDIVLVGGAAHLALPDLGDLDVLAAAVTFGFLEAGLVATAFENFGALGPGAWIEACAGILLMLGVVLVRARASADLPVAVPAG